MSSGALLGAIAGLVRRVTEQSAAEVSALGVGVPGLVDDSGVLHFAPNLPMGEGVDFSGGLRAMVGVKRVLIDNDATCATLGEWSAGAARGADDALVVTLGTGIGGGLVAAGRLVRGAHGFAGEIGHVVVDPGGPLCSCGKRGCWERYASGSGLARLAREAALAGRIEAAVRLAGGDPEAVRGEHVTRAAAAGDEHAKAVIEELAWWLALGLSNLVSILDPELVVLGGGLMSAGDLVLLPTRRSFLELTGARRARCEVPVVLAALGERAGAVGAALLARHWHRSDPRLAPGSLPPGPLEP